MKAESVLASTLVAPTAKPPGLLAMLREDIGSVFQRDPAALESWIIRCTP